MCVVIISAVLMQLVKRGTVCYNVTATQVTQAKVSTASPFRIVKMCTTEFLLKVVSTR
ncbi:hypothetical protein HOLleu_24396 [Holothuria leucospilota]|uniref:Uncharacterized protein n=1 Tax=Holothuria leucospilota TaxID=206669 RepID=A0A9Q1H6A0_HOLLE|nr:hypothetical protein HOLleu_24396 [Holothuria leucospilota]